MKNYIYMETNMKTVYSYMYIYTHTYINESLCYTRETNTL